MGILSTAVAEKEYASMIKGHAQAEEEQAEAARSMKQVDPAIAREHDMMALAHQRSRVRLRACAGTGVHGWANECPKTRRLCLNDIEFQFSVR